MAKFNDDEPGFIVVIGTSAGGIRALEELVLQLNKEMNAAFFIVLHLSRKGISDTLFNRLQQLSILPCRVAIHNETIRRGNVYLAPPDHHLLLYKNKIVIGKGAYENRWRPSINNLFRSAAANYNSRVIGIILTGLLDDGTAGMATIKRAGGRTVVQDPQEADYPDMPLSVLESVQVDFVESLSKMGSLISELVNGTIPEEIPVPHDIIQETKMDLSVSTRVENMREFDKSEMNCPDCGGGLFITQKESPVHYRCHVGHSYTERELIIRLSEVIEGTFWTALRMMEERRTLLLKMAKNDHKRGYETSAKYYQERVTEMETHIENLKQILFTTSSID